MNKTNDVYTETFSKAFDSALNELAKNKCNTIADLMLFSEYILNITCSLSDGRIMSRRKFYKSINDLPDDCKHDYEIYLKNCQKH